MAKKSFKLGFESLLSSDDREYNRKDNNLQKNEIRATFIISSEQLEKIKAISYWERKMIKTVLWEALDKYITQYNTENGEIVLPKKQ